MTIALLPLRIRFSFHLRSSGDALLFALAAAIVFIVPASLHADYAGPVPAPIHAYGARGAFAVHTETLPSPGWPGRFVTVYLPDNAPGPRPVWFFSHGFAGTDVAFYDELLRHLASHGAVAVFSPYPANLLRVAENYSILFDGFTAAATHYAARLDLTRVGFAGHSYGGGAVPALALRGVRDHGWGSNSLALLILAPWFSAFVSDADLASFPAHTQALVQIYEDDLINDHRMAIDLFRHLALPADNKDYVMLRSDRIDGYNYAANHRVPTGVATPNGIFNALDVWGVHRLAQALAASAFNGDANARAVALGHGSDAQLQMGATASGRALRRMTRTDSPVPLFSSSRYLQPWDSNLNPRRAATLPAAESRPRLANLSARARSASGDDVLIVGAVLSGPRPKSLLVRAVGPALLDAGLADAMPDPRLTFFRGQVVDLEIDNWADTPDPDTLAAATAEVGALPLREASKDAALLASFPAGALTAHAAPHDGSSPGLTVLELFDADRDSATTLTNLSARARVGAGDEVLIAGFVIDSDVPLRVLVRGLGPALSAGGVPHPLRDPQLRLFRESDFIAANDHWSANPADADALAHAAAIVGASPLAAASTDAALLLTLPPGIYTAQLSATDGEPGIGLIELYLVP